MKRFLGRYHFYSFRGRNGKRSPAIDRWRGQWHWRFSGWWMGKRPSRIELTDSGLPYSALATFEICLYGPQWSKHDSPSTHIACTQCSVAQASVLHASSCCALLHLSHSLHLGKLRYQPTRPIDHDDVQLVPATQPGPAWRIDPRDL